MNKLLTTTAIAAALAIAACDQSPQKADGAVDQGDMGVATATGNGTVADTGQDTGTGGDIGGAGEATADTNTAAPNAADNTAP